MMIGETFEIAFPTGYCSICRWNDDLMPRIQAQLEQEMNVDAGLPPAKNKLLVSFAELPQR